MERADIERIAQEYGIMLIPKRKVLVFKCGDRTFVGDAEVVLKARSEQQHREVFAWIVEECRRLDALLAADDELVRCARSGSQSARQTIVEECIERIRGNTQTTSELLLQAARAFAQEHLEDALASQYPWSYGQLYQMVRAWVRETYRV
jgi:hypothetical protein